MSFPHRILATIISTEGRVERLLSKRLIFGPLVLLVAVAFGIRWALVTLSVPTVGPDYGHYLIGANWYAGVDRTGEGPFDPPFVPLLILALVPLVGTITTLQLLGPIALVSLFVAAVFFLERFVPRWAAVVSSAVFVQWQTFSEFITSRMTSFRASGSSVCSMRLLRDRSADGVRAGSKSSRAQFYF